MSHRQNIARCARMVLGRNATHLQQSTGKRASKASAMPCVEPRYRMMNNNTPDSIRTALSSRSRAQSLRALKSQSKRATFSNAALAAAISPEPVVDSHAAPVSSPQATSSTAPAPLTKKATPPPASLLANQHISFIGAGKMAGAILGGIVKSKQVAADHITACDPHAPRRKELETDYGVNTTPDNVKAATAANILFVAVKPQTMSRVFQQLGGKISKDTLIISVVAGYTIDQLQRGFGVDSVVRAMPNTPALINESVTCWTISPEVTAVQRRQARELFSSFGMDIYLPEEEKMDMATALSGSGPAMCHLMLEAMIDSGVHMGLPRDVARQMVTNTVRGAVNLVEASASHPSMLRNDITSPGGTTAAALYEIEKGGLRTVMSDAVWAAYRRSRELGGLDSCVGPGRFQHYTQLELPEELVENLQQVTESMNDIKELAESTDEAVESK